MLNWMKKQEQTPKNEFLPYSCQHAWPHTFSTATVENAKILFMDLDEVLSQQQSSEMKGHSKLQSHFKLTNHSVILW